MSSKFQAIRGMNDILPEKIQYWHFLEQALKALVQSYGYQEIRFPILEATALFKRTIGDVTDIVEKEMYTFDDRNGESLSLRPEGTAGCVRACIQEGLLYNQTQKLWYLGPMYRHERPQKGRYRQFHQFGIEAFGYSGFEIEVELILLTKRLWKMLGIDKAIHLEINTLGTSEERKNYKEALVAFLSQHQDELDEDSQRRLHTNPLRILDSKSQDTQKLLANAPVLLDYLAEESLKSFEQFKSALKALDVEFTFNPRLVRGLDYYSHLVFEWVTESLGAQGTVCAGGRYDSLVPLLGGKPTPAVGLACGVERLILMLEKVKTLSPKAVDIYAICSGEKAWQAYMALAEQIKNEMPHLHLACAHQSQSSFKSQFKKADKSGAHYALIIGDDELANDTVTLKPLREKAQQKTVSRDVLLDEIKGFGIAL